ncbi:hypothetical protein ZWY2020_046829 [Hordeum vulgare]|nr:hypothetical protein ZWY2020_046829 [Hordeum vulgare]
MDARRSFFAKPWSSSPLACFAQLAPTGPLCSIPMPPDKDIVSPVRLLHPREHAAPEPRPQHHAPDSSSGLLLVLAYFSSSLSIVVMPYPCSHSRLAINIYFPPLLLQHRHVNARLEPCRCILHAAA